uniref:Uncharacterized protein n=1 Tax=Candidatus Magnetananas rongchengensis TaxID=1463558 RepID=A0A3S6IW47_9BACT|nr:hypothetical protein [Candidatus Magnetananas rongchenensis]
MDEDQSGQLNGQLGGHLSEHLDTKLDTKTVSRTVRHLDGHLDGHLKKNNKNKNKEHKKKGKEEKNKTDGHLVGQLNGQLHNYPETNKKQSKNAQKSNSEKSEQLDGHLVGQLSGQLSEHLVEQLDGHLVENSFYWMNENHIKIMNFLIQLRSKVTRLKDIERSTGTSYGTIRNSMRKLISNHLILSKSHYRDGAFRGIKFTLNEPLCEEFKKWQKSEHLNEHLAGQLSGQLSGQLDKNPNQKENSLSSSSSFSYKGKTTPKTIEILETDIELGYWRQKKLSSKQFLTWLRMFNNDIDLLVESLSHCAFAMVDLNEEKEKSIRDVFSWFFRIVERNGTYPRPKDYKSCKQKQIESKERIIGEKQKELKLLEELYQKNNKIDKELKFQKMLSNKDSNEFKWCFNRLNSFTQGLSRTHPAYLSQMRALFDKLEEIQYIKTLLTSKDEKALEIAQEYKEKQPDLINEALNYDASKIINEKKPNQIKESAKQPPEVPKNQNNESKEGYRVLHIMTDSATQWRLLDSDQKEPYFKEARKAWKSQKVIEDAAKRLYIEETLAMKDEGVGKLLEQLKTKWWGFSDKDDEKLDCLDQVMNRIPNIDAESTEFQAGIYYVDENIQKILAEEENGG